MRELKFRAWDDGKMIYSDSFSCEQYADYAWLCKFFGSIRPDSIIMQSTGWMDKNGVNIYEGDVLRGIASTGFGGKSTKHKERFFDISFVPGRFHLDFFVEESAGNYRFLPSPEDCEVIGNIYQPNNNEQPTNIRPVS